jgi:hypothetical protein
MLFHLVRVGSAFFPSLHLSLPLFLWHVENGLRVCCNYNGTGKVSSSFCCLESGRGPGKRPYLRGGDIRRVAMERWKGTVKGWRDVMHCTQWTCCISDG